MAFTFFQGLLWLLEGIGRRISLFWNLIFSVVPALHINAVVQEIPRSFETTRPANIAVNRQSTR